MPEGDDVGPHARRLVEGFRAKWNRFRVKKTRQTNK
jgi:hypothetical protein